ncbi:MAG: vitamin K epoxide reductase family protein [Acidobacteriota bacterium]|nr:vitamin K epoxide reductase family protein [Acidobacteriota bacterium]
MSIILALLALVGLAISTYFTAVAFHWVTPDTRWVPAICRLDSETCASVIFTPSARVFGPPNSLLGQMYYAALIIAIGLDRLIDARVWRIFVATSLVTIGLAVYLSYRLLVTLKVPCPLCFTSHGINAIICGVLLLNSPTH